MEDAFGLPDTLLVLGGTSDIGRATARALVSERARTVILAGREEERLRRAGDELAALGAKSVETAHFDALDTDSHEAFVADLFSREGDIDAVLVAVGVLGDQAVAERDPVAALEIARTNYVGPVSLMVPIARRLVEQGHGTLVVLSSVAAERPRKSNFVYGSSKAGLDAFATGLGDSLAGTGVRVLVVRPGFVHTRMTAGRRAGPFSTRPEVVADAIVGALREGRETIWVPPILRWVFSVLRHLPRALFRRIPL
ncbi:MAG: decaprenylphospho-beta-D-erythro-pentofuranosid-2-ulose 2-reductase [Nitriliruptorales bacterium]